MLFSRFFSIEEQPKDDWFDPILNSDTALFVDPFLIFKEAAESPWSRAHRDLVAHFDRCFQLLAQGNCDYSSLAVRKALSLLTFHEPVEFCLGYTSQGTAGQGGGAGYARAIAQAMCDAIRRGQEDIRHFEELGIFNEGIGPDRISDFTCNILKGHFAEYTTEVAEQHGLPVSPVELECSAVDDQRLRWISVTHDLPINPANGQPILLCPERFLRDLPQIEKTSWWGWHQTQMLRDDVNYEVLTNVDKAFIVRQARENPDSVREYVNQMEGAPPDPYDLDDDPKGAWIWDKASFEFAERNPKKLESPSSVRDLQHMMQIIVQAFRQFIQEGGGWRLLWDSSGKEKPESAAQLLFRGITEHYCRANGIVIDREVELGRGPVDFAFSNGYEARALLEIKKLENGKFWNGLENQLVSYLDSDNCPNGVFLAIQFRDKGHFNERLREVPTRLHVLKERRNDLNIAFEHVVAYPQQSASRL